MNKANDDNNDSDDGDDSDDDNDNDDNNDLNRGFDRLREVLPGLGPETPLSKFETLQMAQEYINQLTTLLET